MELVKIGIVDDPGKYPSALLPWENQRAPPVLPRPPDALLVKRKDGSDDGRLIEEVRRHARSKSAIELLANAAVLWSTKRPLALALADLAVTGRAAHATLTSASDAAILARAMALGAPAAGLSALVKEVHDHAWALEKFLRSSAKARASMPVAEDVLGKRRWIAVSSDEDAPWRPVNTSASAHAQRDVVVTLPASYSGRAWRTRYTLAGSPAACKGIVLFLHGGGSRAEEGDELARALLEQTGDRYVVIAPDMPGCGYSERIAASEVGLDAATPLAAHAELDGPFPFLELLDVFVERFVAAVRTDVPALAQKPLYAVVGGSLGGNLTLRAAQRGTLGAGAYVAWSPASLWDPVDDPLGLKNMAGLEAFKVAAMGELEDTNLDGNGDFDRDARRRYFWQSFERSIAGIPPAVTMWWDEKWPPVKQWRAHAQEERKEVYDEQHRRYSWRYSYEQLFFSWQYPKASPRRLKIDAARPLMLLGGTGDDFQGANIFSRVQSVGLGGEPIPAAQRVVLLGRTGHSIHDERPRLLAREIDGFVRRVTSP